MSERDVETVVRLLTIEPLTRKELLEAMREERDIGDSAMRVAIEGARAAGHLIVHDGERYSIAQSYEEYIAWRDKDPLPRAKRLLEEIRQMDERASRTWPEQLRTGVA